MEGRDANGVLKRYQPDTRLTLCSTAIIARPPQFLTSIDEIGEYFRDVCGRAMERDVRDMVVSDDRLADTELSRYPDGTNVVCVALARLTDGRIGELTGVQAWDS